ncbi:MAG: DUF6364 family protein [Saprospiraceae bacterium]
MDAKLTLKLDKVVINKAKEYAAARKRSLSAMIESYLKSLVEKGSVNPNDEIEISPFVKSMATGVKVPADLDYKKEYGDHLVDKYN